MSLWNAHTRSPSAPVPAADGTPVGRQQLEDWLVARIAEVGKTGTGQIDVDESVIANGLGSASSVALMSELSKVLGVALPSTLPWEYPSIRTLAEHVAGLVRSPSAD